MKRVLQITAALIGLFLFGTAGALTYVRNENEANPVLLVAGTNNNNPNVTALYLMGAGSRLKQRILPPAYVYWNTTCWSDDYWFYVVASQTKEESNTTSGSLWRISRNGQRSEHVTNKDINLDFACTPDGKWLLYTSTDLTGKVDVIRVQSHDGQNPENLTAAFEPTVEFSNQQIRVSDNGQWIYFRVLQQDNNYDVFRMPIEGGGAENLTAEIEESAWLIAATDDWLLFLTQHMIYLTDPDGSNRRTLFSDAAQISETRWVTWIAPLKLVIAATYSQESAWLWAFEMPEATLQWRYEGLTLWDVSPTDGSFVVKDETDSILYMGADGRHPPKVILKNGEYRAANLQPNGELTFLRQLPTPIPTTAPGDSALWQMRLQDATTQKIYQPISREGEIWGWSRDGKWVAILDFDLNINSSAYHYVIANSDGKPAYRLDHLMLYTWLPPIDRAWSPASLLILGGGLLLGGLYHRKVQP